MQVEKFGLVSCSISSTIHCSRWSGGNTLAQSLLFVFFFLFLNSSGRHIRPSDESKYSKSLSPTHHIEYESSFRRKKKSFWKNEVSIFNLITSVLYELNLLNFNFIIIILGHIIKNFWRFLVILMEINNMIVIFSLIRTL